MMRELADSTMSIISARGVAWRVVREALWDSYAREGLYHEAVDFLHCARSA
jgi:hypothetical protein